MCLKLTGMRRRRFSPQTIQAGLARDATWSLPLLTPSVCRKREQERHHSTAVGKHENALELEAGYYIVELPLNTEQWQCNAGAQCGLVVEK
jgi:hypothetical protein